MLLDPQAVVPTLVSLISGPSSWPAPRLGLPERLVRSPGRSGSFFLTLLLSVALLYPHDAGAQATSDPGLGSDNMVGSEVRLAPGVGVVRGSVAAVLRGSAALRIGPWILVGGEAVVPLTEVRAAAPTSPDRSELSLRYGGIRVSMQRPHLGQADPWALSLLLGTGTARVRSSVLETELGVSNFFVLEPSLGYEFGALGPIRMGGVLAYRLPMGARDLPGVRSGQLRGVSAFVTMDLRRRP